VYTVGAPVPLTGAFTDAGASDTHTAQWTIDGVTFAGALAEGSGSGTVTGSYTFTAPGVYPLTLTVTDDDGGVASDVVPVTILHQPTATSMTSSASPSAFGEPVTFTATVSPAGGGAGVPSGTVQFRVDGAVFDDPVPLINGAASIDTAGLSAQPHAITAVYSGDGFFAASTSVALSQVVNDAATSTSVSASALTPLLGVDGLTLRALISVLPPGSGSPSGTVTFYDGATALGTANLVNGTASFVLGDTALTAGPHTLRAVYSGDGNFLGSESTASTNVLAPSSIQGLVYLDSNNDGQVSFGESAVPGVTVTLSGADDLGQAVNRTVQTDADGVYAFTNLRPSDPAGYTLTETQPANLLDGRDTPGTVNGVSLGSAAVNDRFSGVVLAQGGSTGENYNFGERPASGGGVSGGDTATIGYWQNRNGQNLLLALNGGASATRLGHWLASTFPNLYAALDGNTNVQVACFYKTLFARISKTAPAGPPKVDCQVLATAFAVYVTNQTLAGTTAVPYGFKVNATGVGSHTFNVGGNGAAFGVANQSSISVMTLLLAANTRSRNGVLYDQNGDARISSSEAGLRTMANDVFSGINETGDI
jgi:hypothetical protein